MPTCRQLAKDMLTCDPTTLRVVKRVVDEGYGATFAEGMALESAASKAHMKTVTADAVAKRREQVQARGREQRQS